MLGVLGALAVRESFAVRLRRFERVLIEALKKRVIVDQDGFIRVPVHHCFGRQVEIIVLPVSYEQDRDDSEYFECVTEDGTVYRLKDWTDDAFNKVSIMSACKGDATTAEDLFDV